MNISNFKFLKKLLDKEILYLDSNYLYDETGSKILKFNLCYKCLLPLQDIWEIITIMDLEFDVLDFYMELIFDYLDTLCPNKEITQVIISLYGPLLEDDYFMIWSRYIDELFERSNLKNLKFTWQLYYENEPSSLPSSTINSIIQRGYSVNSIVFDN